MVKFIVFCICMWGHLFGMSLTKSISEIKADDIDYNGKKICLAGSVRIDHHLGMLHCDKAELVLLDGHKEVKNAGPAPTSAPERIILQHNVQLEMKNGSSLVADHADINCLELEGVFTAALPHKVVYTTYLEEEGKRVPVITSSQTMRIKMKKDEKTAQYVLSDIQGEGAVTIEYQAGAKT